MVEHTGWLLDVYANQQAVTLWLLGEDDQRHCFSQVFPVTFYAAGPFSRLRQLWRYVRARFSHIHLSRTQRKDLFSGFVDVLALQAPGPISQQNVFHDIRHRFADLDYYDADIPLTLRYAASFKVFPLARCQMVVNKSGEIKEIFPLNTPWDLNPEQPPLRIMSIEPDVDPFYSEPSYLHFVSNSKETRASLKDSARLLLINVQGKLRRYDPDLIVTKWGDTWSFPYLMQLQQKIHASYFNLNRDQHRQPLQRKENSYFTYGQVVHRGQQVHLFGRWHIDQRNAMMYGEYGLAGVFEQARVTGLPIQEVARKSPGSGITAMQMIVALRRDILVPYQKQQTERFKRATDLIQADRGGLVYQPRIGLHRDVAEIDFVSMYPSIMAAFNISPETVGNQSAQTTTVPGLDLSIDQSHEGLVPATLKPLLAKRMAIKQQLATMNHRDCRYQSLKARSSSLKWLLVVSFGYLGYKNARFGRIEGHEAVTAFSREMLLRAKEAAEDMGFTVLHMYIDGLWVQRNNGQTGSYVQPLLEEIMARTGLPIIPEGIYRWVVFLPSRLDKRIPVANRYFGAFTDGSLKLRGIEARRHDTPPFIAQIQLALLQMLSKVAANQSLETCLPGIVTMLRQCLADLRCGRIVLEELLVKQRLSRVLDEYKTPSPAALAAAQLNAVGKQLRPGQRVRFIYTRGRPGVHAWGLPVPFDPTTIDVQRYADLLLRAASNVLQPLIDEGTMRSLVTSGSQQLPLPFNRGS